MGAREYRLDRKTSSARLRSARNKKTSIEENQERGSRTGNAMPVGAVKQKERRVDALALGADEGRDKLRKAAGRSTCPVIRRCPNGETRTRIPRAPPGEHIARRGEPAELKHLSRRRRRKKHRFR